MRILRFCVKAVLIVVVGVICIQILIALGVLALGIGGPGIDQRFQEIGRELNASGASVIMIYRYTLDFLSMFVSVM